MKANRTSKRSFSLSLADDEPVILTSVIAIDDKNMSRTILGYVVIPITEAAAESAWRSSPGVEVPLPTGFIPCGLEADLPPDHPFRLETNYIESPQVVLGNIVPMHLLRRVPSGLRIRSLGRGQLQMILGVEHDSGGIPASHFIHHANFYFGLLGTCRAELAHRLMIQAAKRAPCAVLEALELGRMPRIGKLQTEQRPDLPSLSPEEIAPVLLHPDDDIYRRARSILRSMHRN